MMFSASMILHIPGLACLIILAAAAFLPLRRRVGGEEGGLADRLVFMAAILAPLLFAIQLILSRGLVASFDVALWLAIAINLLLFAFFAMVRRDAARLAPIFFSYMALLALIGWLAAFAEPPTVEGSGRKIDVWLIFHIAVALLTYGLSSIAAVAATAVFMQERALKLKKPSRLTSSLPSVADGDRLQGQLLIAAQAVLTLGLMTGIGLSYVESGHLFEFNHKNLLSVAAFLLIAVLLVLQERGSLRGRRAGQFILLAYLLLTLAFLGVKFVTDLLL